MTIKINVVPAAVVVSLFVYDHIKTKIDARQAAKLYLAAHEAFEETQKAHETQIEYLCHMLDENDIEVNEFDLIALNFNQTAE